jgi:ribosomal protein S18 acetylase RimI-like enzyme
LVLAGSGSTTLLAEADGRPVGFVDFGACRDDDLPGSVGEVMAVYVHPEAWRRRFGERLMREALEQLQSGDLDPVVLWVIEGNHRTIAFYERLGFARDGAIRHYEMYGRAIAVVRLRRYAGAQSPGQLRTPDYCEDGGTLDESPCRLRVTELDRLSAARHDTFRYLSI